VGEPYEVRFIADRLTIKPPKKDGDMSIEVFTGIYSLPHLSNGFIWQGLQSTNFEVIIRPISAERAGAFVSGKTLQGDGMEEGMDETA